jgi:hypothetical protein
MQPCGTHCPTAEARVPKNKFVLCIKSWSFNFFQKTFLLMVLHDVIFNTIVKI